MTSAFENFLARLQLDPAAREAFRRDRRMEGVQAGLAEAELVALETVDVDELRAASHQMAYRRALAIRFAGASRSWWRHRQLVQRRRR